MGLTTKDNLKRCSNGDHDFEPNTTMDYFRCDHCGIRPYQVQMQKLQSRINELEWKLKQFKPHGTDDCENYDCKDGRITIFKANQFCISCDPDGYKSYPEIITV